MLAELLLSVFGTTLSDVAGVWACSAEPKQGNYTWHLDEVSPSKLAGLILPEDGVATLSSMSITEVIWQPSDNGASQFSLSLHEPGGHYIKLGGTGPQKLAGKFSSVGRELDADVVGTLLAEAGRIELRVGWPGEPNSGGVAHLICHRATEE